MNIIFEEKKTVAFGDLTPGTVFYLDRHLYMKTTDSTDCCNEVTTNAVHLIDGQLEYICSDECVQIADAQLVVKQ